MTKSELKDFKKINPDKKLGEWVTEEMPVEKKSYDPETNRVEVKTESIKQKVK